MAPTNYALAEQLAESLRRRAWRVTAAESCTGGGIASAITDVPGASGWFDMAFVTYSNASKLKLVGVDPNVLTEHGAVSEAVARQMALGAMFEARANLSVAVSGIAGPSGGTDEKPIGMVCFAWATAAGVECETQYFTGDRASIRHQTVAHALSGLIRLAEADKAQKTQ